MQLLFDEFEAALKEARAAAQPRPRPNLLRTPAVGDLVRILPNHSCPVANLADELKAVSWDADGSDVDVATWPVSARGCVRCSRESLT